MLRPRRDDGDLPALPRDKCYAKTTALGTPGTTVSEHCKNVAEVARALLASSPDAVKRRLSGNVAIETAIHDVGKVSPGFQLKYFAEALRQELPTFFADPSCFIDRHAEIGEAAVLARLGPARTDLAEIVGSHHGSRSARLYPDDAPVYGGPSWARERQALLGDLAQKYGPPSTCRLSFADQCVLGGLVCVADWIGSDETHFPADRPLSDDVRALTAERAVRAAGWNVPQFRGGLSFEDIFGFSPTSTPAGTPSPVAHP